MVVLFKGQSIISYFLMGEELSKITYNDGSEYTGQARNGKEHGKGKIVYINKTVLEGSFIDG